MQRTFMLAPYTVPSLVLTGLTRAGLVAANALEIANPRVVRRADLAYGAHPRQRLDVYAPAQASAEARGGPCVVFLHGGNWTYFGKDDFRFVGAALAERGCTVFVPSFRCFPDVRIDDQLLDCARALRWARRHARAYGGDPARLYVAGHSSGAHLASLLALDPHRLARVGGGAGWLAGCVGIGGPYHFAPVANPYMADFFGPAHRYGDVQPVRHARRDAPPTLLVHGLADRMVRPQNARELARRLNAAGACVQLELVPGDGHASVLERWVRPRRAADRVLDGIGEFLGLPPPRAAAAPVENAAGVA
jgi:acetyl esterase/lipase